MNAIGAQIKIIISYVFTPKSNSTKLIKTTFVNFFFFKNNIDTQLQHSHEIVR